MSPTKPSHADSPSITIFIVDDEPMLLDLAAAVLRPLGFDVRTFRDPKKALSEYAKVKPVVIVTDYSMDEMNGLDLVREIRRTNPEQKAMLLSGTVDESVFAAAPDKPDQFLAKPYQIREFVEAIQKLVKA